MPSSRTSVRIVLIAIAIGIIALLVVANNMGFDLSFIPQSKLPVPAVSMARNWAGFVAASNILSPKSDVQGVSASWIVPSVKDSGSDAYSSVWVGIGGLYDHTLVQVGTAQDFTNGSAKYYAWYELLPDTAITIKSIQVSQGDQMNASISLIDSNSQLWSISIEDLTSNQKFQSNFTYSSKQLTAEWIIERPQINNALVELSNFGSITFTDCNANLSGKTGSITDFSYNQVFMDPQLKNNHSIQLVNVAYPINNGTQFTVNYIST